MATTGTAAWSKYFNTGKDIPSVLKKTKSMQIAIKTTHLDTNLTVQHKCRLYETF